MRELDHKEDEHCRIMLLNCGAGEDSLRVCKEIKSVNPKGNHS